MREYQMIQKDDITKFDPFFQLFSFELSGGNLVNSEQNQHHIAQRLLFEISNEFQSYVFTFVMVYMGLSMTMKILPKNEDFKDLAIFGICI